MTDTWTPGPLRLPKGWQPIGKSWKRVRGKGKGKDPSKRLDSDDIGIVFRILKIHLKI